ncbi:MAG: hypothetical protein CVT73_02640 [Alphaproteobacteria bacterium HGW-Alphaproteobacteria-12]|nr:MAG: hypothetical protein CVT73_02640 [Alphaproteobacteria bacterium HGW-Alphaproteobacteria-12]
MSNGFDAMGGQGKAQGQNETAWQYGRSGEPLPELHVFSRLSELDAAYAAELARRRARQETLEREIHEQAKRLAAPLENAAAEAPRKRRFFSRSARA